ncbi:MAG: hypothetical protein RRA45_07290 [Saccharolobus sp.]|uniref:hypothetical protein n=1 Tax=Saccharolobus sp. TaxID=2100761 RepID=UPI0028CCFD0B|nr:hypothetical protein [Saccharolobus sp.]MDT7862001.1 hypothetical protein [Saccharolobus sp.]
MKRVILSLIFLILSLISYFISKSNLLLWSTISTLSFWLFVILIIPKSFYKFIGNKLIKYKKYKSLWITLILYMAYHVILYSFFFYLLLPGSIRGIPLIFTINAGIGYSIPPPLPYFLEWVSNSPAIWFFIGPYEGDVIPFSTFMGIILAILIALNVVEIKDLWRLSRTRINKSIVLVPSLGLVSGSSCCVFLPSIVMYSIALSITSITATILSILSSFIYFVLVYYSLPIVSALVLFHNLTLLDKLLIRFKL